MPLYEYKCSECEKEVTLLQSHTDLAPVCDCKEDENHPVMERQLSLGSFALKGSGWYRDGYSNKK